MAREIIIGTLSTHSDEVENGLGERFAIERSVGQRVVQDVMLTRVHAAMLGRGQQDAAACVQRWLTGDTARVPGRTALEAQAGTLEQLEQELRAAGQPRDAAYVELARFCVLACGAAS